MTSAGARISVVGIDENNTRWFWQIANNSWNLYADKATNFTCIQSAELYAARIRASERLKDRDEQMDAVWVEVVS